MKRLKGDLVFVVAPGPEIQREVWLPAGVAGPFAFMLGHLRARRVGWKFRWRPDRALKVSLPALRAAWPEDGAAGIPYARDLIRAAWVAGPTAFPLPAAGGPEKSK